MNISAYGITDATTGFGKAFRLHTAVLRKIGSVDFGDFQPRQKKGEVGYFHGSPFFSKVFPRHDRNIAYWVCESTELTEDYFRHVHRFDEIWTCSKFCRNVLEDELDVPVHLVPHYATRFSHKLTGNDDPVFLVAFNGSSRIGRKNPVESIRAVKAVNPKAKIVVKLKNCNDHYRHWITRELQGMQYEIVDGFMTKKELEAIYDRTDIMVALHSSEGFGLHLLEYLALGKPVVATAFGGNVDYMNEVNSFLVEADTVPCTDDYFQGVWGKPKFDSAVAQIAAASAVFGDEERAKYVEQSAKSFSFETTMLATSAVL